MSKEQTEDQTILLLRELVKWNKFQGMIKAKEVLLDALRNDSEKLAYAASDGRGSQEVARTAGVSHTTVVSYWNRWATLGIVEPLAVKGGTRYRAVFSLSDLGIQVPSSTTGRSLSFPKSKTDVETEMRESTYSILAE
jgi:hypothetical protein